jgi:beta-galactosidase GanA
MRLGVCYYPEHWPESWWPEDARQMVDLGIRQVRIGEFCWSRVEPLPGQFDWAWLDRAVQVLADVGLQIVMCTPTATPPKWLVDADPGMLAVGADGRFALSFGLSTAEARARAQAAPRRARRAHARTTRAPRARVGLNAALSRSSDFSRRRLRMDVLI